MSGPRDLFPWETPDDPYWDLRGLDLETLAPRRVYDREGEELCTCTPGQKRRRYDLCHRCEGHRVDALT